MEELITRMRAKVWGWGTFALAPVQMHSSSTSTSASVGRSVIISSAAGRYADRPDSSSWSRTVDSKSVNCSGLVM